MPAAFPSLDTERGPECRHKLISGPHLGIRGQHSLRRWGRLCVFPVCAHSLGVPDAFEVELAETISRHLELSGYELIARQNVEQGHNAVSVDPLFLLGEDPLYPSGAVSQPCIQIGRRRTRQPRLVPALLICRCCLRARGSHSSDFSPSSTSPTVRHSPVRGSISANCFPSHMRATRVGVGRGLGSGTGSRGWLSLMV